jgi:hypothetical protein
MRFGTWKVRTLYKAGSLLKLSKELSKYKLDFVGVQKVRWVGGGAAQKCRRIHIFLPKRELES